MKIFEAALIGWGIAAAYFAVIWAISVKVRNYGFLDVAWSYGIAVLAPLYSLMGSGWAPRRWALVGVGAAWSLRLGTHILIRVVRHHPAEDPRYRTLRKDWPSPGRFLLFFELQALIAVVLSWPFLLGAFDSSAVFHPVEIAGYSLALAALGGEIMADRQMKVFASNPIHRGEVCQQGLWRYSRHPNYFFESLVWWGFFLSALSHPWGWTTIVCPLLMLWFLLKVTGIPLTEKHSEETRGDKYRRYQRTTSAFIPWFPKKSA